MTLGTVPETAITCDEYVYDMDNDGKEEAESEREGKAREHNILGRYTNPERGDSGTCRIRDTHGLTSAVLPSRFRAQRKHLDLALRSAGSRRLGSAGRMRLSAHLGPCVFGAVSSCPP